MRTLVTGGAGLIGSHIVDLLLEKGYEVTILDSLEKPCHLMGKPSWIPKEAKFILGDVSNKADLSKALEGVEVVFHQAAYQGLLPDFSKFFVVNSSGTALIYELIVENNLPVKKVVVASSQGVYGEGKYECPNHGVMYPEARSLERLMKRDWGVYCPICNEKMKSLPTDESTVKPKTTYAMSKYTQEMIAINLGEMYNIPTVALRYAITQGPRQSIYHAYSGVCSIFSTRLINDLPPIIYEDGMQTRDYIYVGDVAQANLFVMENDAANYQVFNVGTGKRTTVLEFLNILSKKFGKSIEPIMNYEFRLGDIRDFCPDVSKLESLGWKATTPLEVTLEKYVEWIYTQGNVKDYFSEAEALMRKMNVIRGGK